MKLLSVFHFLGVGLKNENLMLQEKQMLRGWIPAGGWGGAPPCPWSWASDAEARGAGPGTQVCTPEGAGAGSHTCHGG